MNQKLVVYLLVPLACNFASKAPFASKLDQSRNSHSLNKDWIPTLKKGEKNILKANYDKKSEKAKATINFSSHIFLRWKRKTLKRKSKFIKFIKYTLDVKVNFEALLSLGCILLSFFYTQKKKKWKTKHFFTKLVI